VVREPRRSRRLASPATITRRYLGRDLTAADLEAIRAIRADPRFPTRAAIAREVCRALRWVSVDGKVKDMSAKVA